MFVKCKIKTTLELPIEFIFNIEKMVVIEKAIDMKQISLNFVNGNINLDFSTYEICAEIFEAFTELLATEESILSDNITLLIL
jgi:hypothetical protein